MAQLKDLIVNGPSRFVGNVMLNTAVGTLSGSNASVSPDHALLISGYNRADDSSGDTWIYWDALGGTDAPWGIKHNQTENKIEFWGSGSATSYINLSNGLHYTQGIYDLRYGSGDYVPTTNGSAVHIPSMSVNYANSAGYASSAGSATDQTARDAAANAQSTANGKWTWNSSDVAGVKVNNAGYADSAGSATNATYATYDSNGNYIIDRYATKAEIPSIPSSLPANGGYADTAGVANSVSWGNVSGRPTSVSQFTNDSGYLTGNVSDSFGLTDVFYGSYTEIHPSLANIIFRSDVRKDENGKLFVCTDFHKAMFQTLDVYSDGNTFGYGYSGILQLDDCFPMTYDFTHNTLARGLKVHKFHQWEVQGIVQHYFIRFYAGNTGFELTLPSGIIWANNKAPEIDAAGYYELSFTYRDGNTPVLGTWNKFAV